jgi:SpoVK/Ycf46/Vps4 family AAA+-type ATPase
MENTLKIELTELVRSGMTGSRGGFALSVGKFISKIKHIDPDLARELSRFINKQSVLRSNEPAAIIPVDADSRMALLERIYPVFIDKPPIFSPTIQTELNQVLREWANLEMLLKAGLAPARMLLFCGEPGVGKTLAAHWLAKQLDLPLLTLNLATVMSSFLGKTGSNVRAVFEHAIKTPCVLLLDEFDAIAKRRDDDTDVGELKRLVNVLLQSLDEWPVNALLVAATNHGDLLDPAVWRRFDRILTFEKPGATLIALFLGDLPLPEQICHHLSKLLEGESFSSITQIVQSARKLALLDNIDFLQAILRLAVQRQQSSSDRHNDVDMLLMYLEGHSFREIGTHFGKSHPTVGKIIKQYLGEIHA